MKKRKTAVSVQADTGESTKGFEKGLNANLHTENNIYG